MELSSVLAATEHRRTRYPLLTLDRDLLCVVDEESARAAAHQVTAPVAAISEGAWRPDFHGDLAGALGMLVLSGLMTRTVTVARRASTELIVTGDLIRPWQHDGDSDLIACEVSWRVLEPARVALLDRRFVTSAGAWPELLVDLAARGLRRSRAHAISAAIAQTGRIETRVLLLLWQLADRIGRVTPEGVIIPVALTHEVLAGLVGARRPSVTSALTRLAKSDLVLRCSGTRYWLLTPKSQRRMERLCGGGSNGHSAAWLNGAAEIAQTAA